MDRASYSRAPKRFLRAFVGVLIFFLVVMAPVMGFLYNTWEIGSIEELVARQLEENGLYGTAFHDDTRDYKLALYRRHRPDVVVLGSSRVMQIRQEMFSRPMVNMGGAADTAAQIDYLVERAFAVHRPKLVLLGVDFWVFNADWPEPPLTLLQARTGLGISLRNLQELMAWIWQDRIPALDLLRVGFRLQRMSGRYGVVAAYTGGGFDAHGSRRPRDEAYGRCSEPKRFTDTLARVRAGKARFEYGDHIDSTRLAAITALVHKLRVQGVEVVLFMPPLAPQVYTAMRENGHYGLLDELARLEEIDGVRVYDYIDPARTMSSDCEYLDGFHGGDIVYARILAQVARREPALAAVVDTAALEATVMRERDRAASELMRLVGADH